MSHHALTVHPPGPVAEDCHIEGRSRYTNDELCMWMPLGAHTHTLPERYSFSPCSKQSHGILRRRTTLGSQSRCLRALPHLGLFYSRAESETESFCSSPAGAHATSLAKDLATMWPGVPWPLRRRRILLCQITTCRRGLAMGLQRENQITLHQRIDLNMPV